MNGVAGPLSYADALAAAGMLLALGRAVPPGRWVDWMADAADAAALEGLV